MSFFSGIEGFFKNLFKNNGAEAKTVLNDVSKFSAEALTIVTEIEAVLKPMITAASPAWVAAAEAFLSKYTPEASTVATFLGTLAKAPVSDIVSDIASFALSFVAPKGTAANLLNLAVELAYSVLKQSTPAAA